MKTTKGETMKITKEMVDKTIELMQKHLPNSDKFQNEKYAKVYLKEFINFRDKWYKNKKERNNENI